MSFFEIDSYNNKFYIIPEELSNSIKDISKEMHSSILTYKKINTKNGNMIYIKEEDYINFSRLLVHTYQKPDASLNIITMAVETAFLMIEKNGINIGSYNILEKLSQDFLKLNFDNNFKEQFKVILASPRSKDFIMRAILCKTVAIKMNLKSNMILRKIFLASFFCDLGEILPNPNSKPHQEMSVQFLQTYVSVGDDIRQAILHHHEYNDGTGFYKIFKNKIHPIARIIRVVDELLILISNKDTEFLKTLKQMSICKLDSTVVKAMIDSINP